MTKFQEEYKEVISKLEPVLDDLPGKIIALDGKPGAGKTTLGRYLAWHFNISLVETDLFRSTYEQENELKYKEQEIKRIIQSRLDLPRPVILEGVIVQKLLKDIGVEPDYSIYVVKEYDYDDWLAPIIRSYEKEFMPKERSNLVIELSFE